MKIEFEAQLFLKGNKTGIAWYADNIIRELAKDPECQCRCNYFSLHYTPDRIKQVEEYKKNRVSMNACGWFHDVLYKLIWPFIPLPYRWFFGKKADVTQFFNYAVPPGVAGKKVAVVHDMAYKACPDTVPSKTRTWLNLVLKRSCKRADQIVTISEFSKSEIVKYLNIPAKKIKVISCGVDVSMFHTEYSAQAIAGVQEQYKIPGDYFLYLGTLEPRKNITRLIQAYHGFWEWAQKAQEKTPYLVLAGGKGWMYDSIFETVRKLKLESYVIFTGYVAEKDVPVLMKGAVAFVFPSLYEGFGMPPIESMACGTPVITSNITSLPEIVGDAGILVDPYDIDDIAEAMKRMVSEPGLSERLIEEGLKRAQNYTWKASAQKFKKVYEELALVQ